MISKFEDPWFRIATVKCAPFYHGKGDFKLVFETKYILLHYILIYSGGRNKVYNLQIRLTLLDLFQTTWVFF